MRRAILIGKGFFLRRLAWTCCLNERPSVRVKRVEDENTRLTRIAEPELDVNAGVVTVRYSMLAESKVDGRLTCGLEDAGPESLDLL